MSYIQIEIGGKIRGLKFNIFGMEKMFEELDGKSAIAFLYAMIWGGLRGNSKAKQDEPDYTYEQVTEWVDELPKEKRIKISESVTKVMTSTQFYKESVDTTTSELTETSEEKKSELQNQTMIT